MKRELLKILWEHEKYDELAEVSALLPVQIKRRLTSQESTYLGVACAIKQRFQDALPYLWKAHMKEPENVEFRLNYANCLKDMGRYSEALDIYDPFKYSAIEPQILLGGSICEIEAGAYERALELLSYGAKKYPNDYRINYHLGRLKFKYEELSESIQYYKKSLDINPQFEPAALNLALASLKGDDVNLGYHLIQQILSHERGSDEFLQAAMTIALEAGHPLLGLHFIELYKMDAKPKTLYTAAELARYVKQPAKCMDLCTKTLAQDPSFAAAYVTLYHSACELGEWTKAVEAKKKFSEDISPQSINASDMPNPWAVFAVSDRAALQFEIAKRYAGFTYNRLPRSKRTERSHGKPVLTVGFVSADFGMHPVTECMLPIFKELRKQINVVAFSFRKHEDSLTAQVRSSVTRFYRCDQMPYQEFLDLVERLSVDIMVDLAGYTAGGRPNFFALGLAPIQINYLGYSGTTGAQCYDYIITDGFLAPLGAEASYSEKVLRLRTPLMSCLLRDERHIKAASRDKYGIADHAFIFCCLASSYKYSPEILRSWAKILEYVDRSVLVLAEGATEAGENLKDFFADLGIARDRIIFAPREETREDHLGRLKLMDLFLDTWPYNAHSLAADALAAGVPLVTLSGEAFASRVAGSLLKGLDLQELITFSQEEYVETAVRLAKNPIEAGEVKSRLKRALESREWPEENARDLLSLMKSL